MRETKRFTFIEWLLIIFGVIVLLIFLFCQIFIPKIIEENKRIEGPFKYASLKSISQSQEVLSEKNNQLV